MGTGNVDFSRQLANIITVYIMPFLAIGAIALVVVIGIRFGMAKDEKTREEAKKSIIPCVSSQRQKIFIFGEGWRKQVNIYRCFRKGERDFALF